MVLSRIGFVALGAAWLASCAPNPGQVALAPTAADSPSETGAKPATESLTISFNEGTYGLSPQANAQLDTAARLYRDGKPEVMIVSGHTDATGNEFNNVVLSAKRANLVKHALVDRGIPAERLQIVAFGSAQPDANVAPSRSAVVTWR